ncbi:MAG: hypothetical protein GQ531_10825 [Sulfurovum sp.]|nr:hypothetical protein [Sulfurovum sp.]
MSPLPSNTALLLESIKIEDGVISNLSYHQKRCDKSRKALYNSSESLILKEHIKPPQKGLYRCRILYNTEVQKVEYLPYKAKEIQTLKVIPSNLDYALKYANRDALNTLLAALPEADDILIEKEGYLTDTSIANIAFYDGEQWFTPEKPLLEGTMRQKLLDQGFLQTRNIKKEDLPLYTQVALMNAMIGFKIVKDIKIIYNYN